MYKNIYDTHPNPAIALYRTWSMLLGTPKMVDSSHLLTDMAYDKSIYFNDRQMATERQANKYPRFGYGDRYWTVHIAGFDRFGLPVISYGQIYWGAENRDLMLDSTGRFLVMPKHGFQVRNSLARYTFLGTGYIHNQHVWFVDLHGETGTNLYNYRRNPRPLNNHLDPVSYVEDKLLTGQKSGVNTWSDRALVPWWEIVDGKIVPASNQAPPAAEPSTDRLQLILDAYDKNTKLRDLRYRRYENVLRKEKGLPPLSVKTSKVSSVEAPAMVENLIANLTISTPAKPTPYGKERLKEART